MEKYSVRKKNPHTTFHYEEQINLAPSVHFSMLNCPQENLPFQFQGKCNNKEAAASL